MSDIYDINFQQQANDILVPDKRNFPNKMLLFAVMQALQWCRDLLFGSYKKGATALPYAPGVYNKYDQVIFKKAVYQSLISNNTVDPSNANAWEIILSNFIGVDERIQFNCSKIVLEYALNKRFGGIFRIPPTPSISDIFISNLSPVKFGFNVGQTIGSSVGQTKSSDNIGSLYPFRQIAGYQINVPTALFSLTNEKEIRDFTDQYNAIGINYLVAQY